MVHRVLRDRSGVRGVGVRVLSDADVRPERWRARRAGRRRPDRRGRRADLVGRRRGHAAARRRVRASPVRLRSRPGQRLRGQRVRRELRRLRARVRAAERDPSVRRRRVPREHVRRRLRQLRHGSAQRLRRAARQRGALRSLRSFVLRCDAGLRGRELRDRLRSGPLAMRRTVRGNTKQRRALRRVRHGLLAGVERPASLRNERLRPSMQPWLRQLRQRREQRMRDAPRHQHQLRSLPRELRGGKNLQHGDRNVHSVLRRHGLLWSLRRRIDLA